MGDELDFRRVILESVFEAREAARPWRTRWSRIGKKAWRGVVVALATLAAAAVDDCGDAERKAHEQPQVAAPASISASVINNNQNTIIIITMPTNDLSPCRVSECRALARGLQ